MIKSLDDVHGEALHLDAILTDLHYQDTGYLMSLRLNIHSYTGPDASGLNALFADRLDELLAERS